MTELPLRIDPVGATLPDGFDLLCAEARAEGYRHLDRLAADWAAGIPRFERDGEALLTAHSGDVLTGIGGLTIDPAEPGALRLRRFYVGQSFRRTGVGRALAARLLTYARARGGPVTVNAATGSEPFWEALGFRADPRNGHTHLLNE